MNEETKKRRKLWLPKTPELPEACASCPFRVGNADEFGVMVDRLRKASGQKGRTTKRHTAAARIRILMEAEKHGGDFQCHGTAYHQDMTLRDASEHRQCPGAARYYRTGEMTT